jgi:hypothetical protein
MKRARITVAIAFLGADSNPESAVDTLRQAGFKVVGMPEELSRHSRLIFPEDSFWEASIDGFDDKQAVDAVVND